MKIKIDKGVSYFATDYEANFLAKKYREIIEKYLYEVEQ